MTTTGAAKAVALIAACLVAAPAFSAEPVAALGKERAAGSRLQWEIRDGSHPNLGPIRFAFLRSPVATPVGGANVSSRVFFSCERNINKIAIELANGTAPDDPGGLQPAVMPRLICTSSRNNRLVQDHLDTRWVVSEIGDLLARGFPPSLLRECISIGIAQEVVLPPGWAHNSARIEFDITPYSKELDSILVTCGEPSAYATTAATSAPPAPPASPAQRPPPAQRPRTDEVPWKTVRTVSSGRTNVRASARIDSAVVIQLDPGAAVQVREGPGEWWRARSAAGKPFEGYIREDRLDLR